MSDFDPNMHPVIPEPQTELSEVTELVPIFPDGALNFEEANNADSKRSKTLLAIQSAIAVAAIAPWTNEGSRVVITGAAEASMHNPLITGLFLGLSTLAIEGIGGWAAAGVFDTGSSEKFFTQLNNKGKKLHIPMERKLPFTTKITLTFLGGSAIGMALEQREDPSRTIEQNHRYAVRTAIWQGGSLAVLGAMGSETLHTAIDNPVNALITGGIIATIGAAGVTLKKKLTPAFNRLFKRASPTEEEV